MLHQIFLHKLEDITYIDRLFWVARGSTGLKDSSFAYWSFLIRNNLFLIRNDLYLIRNALCLIRNDLCLIRNDLFHIGLYKTINRIPLGMTHAYAYG